MVNGQSSLLDFYEFGCLTDDMIQFWDTGKFGSKTNTGTLPGYDIRFLRSLTFKAETWSILATGEPGLYWRVWSIPAALSIPATSAFIQQNLHFVYILENRRKKPGEEENESWFKNIPLGGHIITYFCIYRNLRVD